MKVQCGCQCGRDVSPHDPLRWCEQIGLVRQTKLLVRNRPFILAHLVKDITLGLAMGSLFYKIHPSSFQIKIGA